MKRKQLGYVTASPLIVGAVAGGFLAEYRWATSETKQAAQQVDVLALNQDQTAGQAASQPAEVPMVTELRETSIPAHADLPGIVLLDQTTHGNGQGSFSVPFKAPNDGSKERVRFYIQNVGEKKLYVRLKSPKGNDWIKTSVEPNQVFAGEMQWGAAQDGLWGANFSDDDGSVISSRVVFSAISSS
ncbi:hypothetical protein LJK88_24695 [Paenibacillus sp. P26]|nr:hypothetical protein LJK88_24695 [Paenibacillus sp. P26]UUZ95340.1 hypothetical protein LJK87_13230 [Paenibacillus sp. P25]